jgi:hypothetical protein
MGGSAIGKNQRFIKKILNFFKCRRLCRLPFVQILRNNLHIWIFEFFK